MVTTACASETKEEASLTKLNFKWGKDSTISKSLKVYLASTTQEPKIEKNPETGIYEHHQAKWVSWDEMKKKCYKYLLPVIKWAEKEVKKK